MPWPYWCVQDNKERWMEPAEIDLSQEGLDFALATQGGLRTIHLGLPGRAAWSDPNSPDPVFAIHVDGQVINGAAADLTVEQIETTELEDGSRQTTIHLRHAPSQLEIAYHVVTYAGTALSERWLTARNAGENPVR